MKISLWSVGKTHDSYVKEGIDDFTKRISRYYPAEWHIIPAPKNAVNDLKKKEAEAILSLLHKDDYLIALEERGKQISSEELAAFIQLRANESVKRIVFLIGGAYGLDESVLKRADFAWSLSKLVFPHQLVRLILTEQIYRACSITRNEKYHHQ
jgi:23S rRNA (pseudouridine1915-N3)-methyltransferase